jgi:hypothetical protein
MSKELDVLTGWRRVTTGDGYRLQHPSSPQLGVLQMHLRVQPLATPARLISEMIARLPPGATPHVDGPRSIVTEEMEHAVLFSVSAEHEGILMSWHSGVVFGDEHYARIDGTQAARSPSELGPIVERLTREHVLGLGHARLRWFSYPRPPGWRPLVRADETRWFSPTYHDDRAVITVYKARPRTQDLGLRIYERFLEVQDDELTARSEVVEVRAYLPGGLPMTMSSFSGVRVGEPRLWRVRAVAQDAMFVYPTTLEVLEASKSSKVSEFEQLVRGIRPLPSAAGDGAYSAVF